MRYIHLKLFKIFQFISRIVITVAKLLFSDIISINIFKNITLNDKIFFKIQKPTQISKSNGTINQTCSEQFGAAMNESWKEMKMIG